MKIQKTFIIIAATLLGLVFLGLLFPAGGPRKLRSQIALSKIEITWLKAAIGQYEATYGVYPTGDPALVLKMLLGENPRKIVFLIISPKSTNSIGEFVDPWGTPYGICFPLTNSFVISSAGKDKKFGDADDIIFNSVSNDFVKP
jgi:Type II secretion system (T2SS), protein G